MVAGFGFRAGASHASLRAALHRAWALCGIEEPAQHSLVLLATAQDKAGAACLQALAASLGLPVCPVTPEELAESPTLTDSPRARAARRTGSVAEAAALAAAKRLAGGEPALLHPRAVSPDRLATCAIARFTPVQGIPS